MAARAPIRVPHVPPRAREWARDEVVLELIEAPLGRFPTASSPATTAPPPEKPGLLTLLPTLATVAAAAIALLLLLAMGDQDSRDRVPEPNAKAALRPVTSGPDEFVLYVVDSPAKGKLLREALAVSHGGAAIPGEVLVVRNDEEEAVLQGAVLELRLIRVGEGLPEARLVDLRNQ